MHASAKGARLSFGVVSSTQGHRDSRLDETQNRGTTLGEKSARKNTEKTAASKTLKEKRLDKQSKRASNERSNNTDSVTKATHK